MYVAPNMCGRGIASRLMRRLLEELRSLGHIEKVRLDVNAESRAALRLYKQLGFTIVGTARRELKVDGRYYDLHTMGLHF